MGKKIITILRSKNFLIWIYAYVLGAQKNHLSKMILLITNNIYFSRDIIDPDK